MGAIRQCFACFHSWRNQLTTRVDYENLATARPYEQDRANEQLNFMGPALFQGMSIFELGCGQGSLAAWVKNTLGKVTYHGLEPSPHALLAEAGMEKVWRNGEEFDEHAGVYDLIIASHVLEHIPDVQRVLEGLLEHLSETGYIFLEVPNGSGHPRLSRDTNPGHLHFFTIHSLTLLLARHNLNVTAIASGAFESHRYPDSIRVLARRFQPSPVRGDELAENVILEPGESMVVWGAGGMARELLDLYFPPDLVFCFLDGNPALVGTSLMGRPIYETGYLSKLKKVVLLIASVDFEAEIRKEVTARYSQAVSRIVTMRDLLR